MTGPWEDYAPSKNKASGPWDDYATEEKGIVARLTDPLRQSIATPLEGLAATRRQVSGEGRVSKILDDIAGVVGPKNYTPAAPSLSNLGDVPKAVAESAGSMAMDIPAMLAGGRLGAGLGASIGSVVPVVGTVAGGAAGGVLGGVAGLGASIWSRGYGRSTADAAFGRTGDSSVAPNGEDKARALSSLAAEAALSRIGLKSGLGVAATATAGGAAKQVALQAGKAAGVNAGTEMATEGVNQALVDRKFNQERLEGAGLTGAATGGALRAVSGISDVNAAKKFADVTPQEAAPLMKRLQALHPDESPDTPDQSYKVMNKARQDLDIDANKYASDSGLKKLIERFSESDPYDSTDVTLTKVRKDIAERRVPSPEAMNQLDSSLGQFDEGRLLMGALKEQVVANKVIGMKGANWNEKEGTFGGGFGGSDFNTNYMSPVGKYGKLGVLGPAAYALTGHTIPGTHVLHGMFTDPMSAMMVPAVQTGIFGALKAGSALTGNSNPLKLFQNRYKDSDTGPAGDLPRFSELLAQEDAAEGLDKQRSKANTKAVIDEFRSKASAAKALESQKSRSMEKQVVSSDSEAKAALKAEASAVAALEKQRMAALGREAMTGKPDAGPTSDASVNIRVAKMVQALNAKDAKEKAAAEAADQQAPTVATEVPSAAGKAPRASSTPRDPTFDINTKSGTRKQSIADTKSQRAYGNAVTDNVIARGDIFEASMEVPGLSQASVSFLGQHMAKMTERAFQIKSGNEARGFIERYIDMLPEADQAKLREHFRNFKDPVTDRTFYDTWKD